ncbi:carbohydrate binding protein with CBM9 domain [Tenacibaculum adriaticum]|uniref:Carbohydrate binding protein with CBM9 domain n=1 Tax=Tenacibaculum adriaticum TaxID=413713 RepID=A0A5S5DRX6_9FLAO|nr:carbohydrate-binding family 9-like protein [Tenacibaculum adriaticum]TYP97399.1 carbohydrate binding protein with CBM9 domain [Tenacibaculum adriaticum]
MCVKFKCLAVLFGCFSIMGCAQSKKEIIPETYIAYKTSDKIKIDGEETDGSWNKVNWSIFFIDIEGVKKPKYATKVKMLWDDSNFYILAKLEEPHVWANLKQRDTIIFYNNDFEVFIDPDGDTQNYYELEVNALNTVWDLFLNKPYREENNVVLNDWTLTGLKSAVKVKGTINNAKDIDEGWVLEMAIPWAAFKKSYNENNVPKDTFWKVNFSRVNWQHTLKNGMYERKKDTNGKFLPEYNWVWSPMGVINMHEPEKWGYVYFSSKAIGEDNFTIPEEEKVKWQLYDLYKAQKKYYQTHKKWATSLASFSRNFIKVDNKSLKLSLENHLTGFNISVKSPFSNKTLIIKEDGKIISN